MPKLSSRQRHTLPSAEFGVPVQRKFPMPKKNSNARDFGKINKKVEKESIK